MATILGLPTAVWGTPQQSLPVAGCLSLVPTTVRQAGDQEPRRGFWLGFGAGITSVGFGGDAAAFDIERENGLSIHGRAA